MHQFNFLKIESLIFICFVGGCAPVPYTGYPFVDRTYQYLVDGKILDPELAFEKDMQRCKELQDKTCEGFVNMGIGIFYRDYSPPKRSYKLSRFYLEEALNAFHESGNQKAKSKAYSALETLERKQGEQPGALTK